ncbi:MAG TPA: 6-phosphogluconolactonase [Fibrobacteraceae bacterium]|nr:6-phosphogluconolactonase [Fibrobacteraceae bacterium]
MSPQIHLHAQLEDLWRDFAQWLKSEMDETLQQQEFFHMAIPGGNTPAALFRYLASSEGDSIAWDRIHFWWTDERLVPITDSRSNYRMAAEALLSPRNIPATHIHRIQTELEPRRAAVLFAIELEDTLCRRFTSIPFFDLVLLGVGTDGHVASLFPGSDVEEPHPWSVLARKDGLSRVSLPYEVIGASSRLTFLVTGASKKAIVQRVFHPQTAEDKDLPASILCRRRPDQVWFLDAAAGAFVEVV